MKKKEIITPGYKVTDSDMKCRGYQYEIGREYEHTGSLSVCSSGFHFCNSVNDCFNYYSFDSTNRVFIIEALGSLKIEGDKSCTSKIKFTKELTWIEVLTIVNTGKDNTGRSNSGDSNSGHRNSGNLNSGDSNSGYRNSGNSNSGERNSGNLNSGNSNSGHSNNGDSNSGHRNSGERNSGNLNSGNSNSGHSNNGDRNSGNRNSGERNSGNLNSGNLNSGDSNSGYRNSGAFCIEDNPPLILFDRISKMKVKEWEQHECCTLMYSIDPCIWVPMSIMTDAEKADHPKYETTEGYLKTISMKEAWLNFWHNLKEDKKKLFTSLENFSAWQFEQITGIKI